MKELDITARREAMRWRTDIEQPAFDASGCPRDIHDEQKWEQLRAMRPEFYGRMARVIDRVMQGALEEREALAPLGLKRWDGTTATPEQITSFHELAMAFKSTLEMHAQDTLIAMRTPTETEDNFDEFLALNTLLRYRDGVRGIGLSDINLALYAGIGTAVQVSAAIMQAFSSSSQLYDADLYRSTGPLHKIASSDTQTLSGFLESFVYGNEQLGDWLTMTASGVIDFTDFEALAKKLEACRSQNDMEYMQNNVRIGCPVLFKPKQLTAFWAWQVEAAQKCELLESKIIKIA